MVYRLEMMQEDLLYEMSVIVLSAQVLTRQDIQRLNQVWPS
jgi:hypothetical protein